MFRLMKYLSLKNWCMLICLLFFLVLQIYCDVTLPMYTSEIVSKMQLGESAMSIFATGKIMILYASISICVTIIETFLAASISTSLGKKLRREVFEHVMTYSERESSKFSSATLLTRTTNDVQQVVSAVVLGMRLGIGAPLMAILAIIKIAQSNFSLTIATAVGVTILLIGIMAILFFVTPKLKIVQKLTDRLNGATRENLTGIRVVRAYNAEEYQENKFEKANEEFTKTNIFTSRVMAALNPLIMLVNYGLTISIYWIGCYIIVTNNDPSFFPAMFAFTQLAGQVVMSFMILVMLFMMLPRAQISAKRILEILKSKSSIIDPIQDKEFSQEGGISFKNVGFGYDGANSDVLTDITFSVKSGQTLAIIGGTGSGKSTILKLILKFLQITQGRIFINGVDVSDISQSKLRSIIGYVPQSSFLFSGSIKENISIGRKKLSDDDIVIASKAACAYGFIMNKDKGFESNVSQSGKNFSGGQRQRISIARAIVTKPQILLFDDSFSALDYATDMQVRNNLKQFAPSATKIIVAQRIGTIIDADCILVLENGRIVGNGNHGHLLKTCDTYKKIALSQLSEEEIAI